VPYGGSGDVNLILGDVAVYRGATIFLSIIF